MYRYRVHMNLGMPTACSRDVNAYTDEGAKRTALYAERVTLNPTRNLRVSSVQKMFEVGYRPQMELYNTGTP